MRVKRLLSILAIPALVLAGASLLRAEFGSLQAGVDRSMIALWLGHESIDTTQIYLDANLVRSGLSGQGVRRIVDGHRQGRAVRQRTQRFDEHRQDLLLNQKIPGNDQATTRAQADLPESNHSICRQLDDFY